MQSHHTPSWFFIFIGCLFLASAIALIAYSLRIFRILYGNDPRPVRVGYVLRALVGMYLAVIGSFAYVYSAIDYFDPTSFSFGDLPAFNNSLMSATYFSIATVTSTGYGDIHPKSETAMAVASAEMLIGYLMTVVFFAAVAALAFRGKK